MKKIVAIGVILLVIFSIHPINQASSDTFTGTDDGATTTFTVDKYAKIDWSYDKENDYDYFHAFISEPNNKLYAGEIGECNYGSTYLYTKGTFFFNVSVANIITWTIHTTETNGDYLSDQDTITGNYSTNSKIFISNGSTEITWSYKKATDYDQFYLYLYKIGDRYSFRTLPIKDQSWFLDESGEYYLRIFASNLQYYKITFNGTIPFSVAYPSDDSDSSPSSTSNVSENFTPTAILSTPNKTGQNLATTPFGILGIFALIPLFLLKLRSRKH